jgi:hypothetical protein
LFSRSFCCAIGARAQSDQALADLLLADVYSQLEFQLSSADALDLKAVTLLTGDIAAISILILVHKTVGPLWWISAALMGIAGALFLAAIRTRDCGTLGRTSTSSDCVGRGRRRSR